MVVDSQHVLNDRVTAALGFAELLLEESYGTLNPQQKTVLSSVVAAARDVRDILRDSDPQVIED
ncbi:MAG TPA: hypothetical protein VNM14_12155 [Planctomycetota bacterium]|nr:hypothetical protein [Planctomycetota bacterium]